MSSISKSLRNYHKCAEIRMNIRVWKILGGEVQKLSFKFDFFLCIINFCSSIYLLAKLIGFVSSEIRCFFFVFFFCKAWWCFVFFFFHIFFVFVFQRTRLFYIFFSNNIEVNSNSKSVLSHFIRASLRSEITSFFFRQLLKKLIFLILKSFF